MRYRMERSLFSIKIVCEQDRILHETSATDTKEPYNLASQVCMVKYNGFPEGEIFGFFFELARHGVKNGAVFPRNNRVAKRGL
jgi:hypothetical protein